MCAPLCDAYQYGLFTTGKRIIIEILLEFPKVTILCRFGRTVTFLCFVLLSKLKVYSHCSDKLNLRIYLFHVSVAVNILFYFI